MKHARSCALRRWVYGIDRGERPECDCVSPPVPLGPIPAEAVASHLRAIERGADPNCTHRWQDCPVHGLPNGDLPSLRIVTTCIYGGLETKDGDGWDDHDSHEVWERVWARLDGES